MNRIDDASKAGDRVLYVRLPEGPSEWDWKGTLTSGIMRTAGTPSFRLALVKFDHQEPEDEPRAEMASMLYKL